MGYVAIFLIFVVMGAIAVAQMLSQRVKTEGIEKVHGFVFAGDRFYSPVHTWIQPEEKEVARVGLDDFAVRLIGRIREIIPPKREVRRGKPSIRIAAHAGEVNVPGPIDGTVVEVNSTVLHRPEVVSEDPYGEGWILKMKVQKRGLKDLYSGEKAKEWLLRESDRLHHFLSAEVGVTVADGGEVPKGLSEKIDKEHWQAIVKEFLEKA